MSVQHSRRSFLKLAAAIPAIAAGGAIESSAVALGVPSGCTLKTSLNAYSFNKLLNDNIKQRGPGITLLAVMEFAARCKFDGFDATGYFFPGYPARPRDEYLKQFRQKAADLGLGISGSGVRNNFTTADAAVRTAAVAHIKEWVEVAAAIGAPVLRVFADTQLKSRTWADVSNSATRQQVQDWIAAALRECADHGQKHGVCIGVQNHGDFLQTGQQQVDLIKAVGSQWCKPIVDTGYYKTSDPYADIALVAPTSVNWQIKQSPFGEESNIATDLVRLIRIVRASAYKGYLPIETLSPKGKPYDPFTLVPAFLKQLQDAIAQTG